MGVLPNLLPGYRDVLDEGARGALDAAGWPSKRAETPGLGSDAMFELDSGLRALLVFGTDPAGDDPSRTAFLEGLDLLVVSELAETATTRIADVVLPAAALSERDGTLTNMFRKVQRTYAAVPAPGDARPDWLILAELAQRMGVAEAYAGPDDVMAEIAKAVQGYEGIDYAALGPAAPGRPADPFLPFAPSTEARHVSYEGTHYELATSAGVTCAANAGSDDLVAPLLSWRPGSGAAITGGADETVPGRMTLVPVTRLYDAGAAAARSPVLAPLVPRPYVAMSSFDAAARGLPEGANVSVRGVRGALSAEVRLVDGLTPGTILAPRSLAWDFPPEALTGEMPTADVVVERVDKQAVGGGAVAEVVDDASPRSLGEEA